MRFYPALKGKMGFWNYYTVRLTLDDLVAQVKFATDIHEDKTLEDALQRQLNQSRSKKNIARYLANREDRFFNAIVVAAIGGTPDFTPVKFSIDGDDMLNKIFEKQKLNEHFGVLTFSDDIKTYALDGQHRLSAIKSVLSDDDNSEYKADIGKETIAVVFVIPPAEMEEEEFIKQYRNIFTALNRHAKPMDKAMIIIMDEIDRFAIVSRRLIQEYEPFQWREGGTPKINTAAKGEAMRPNDPFFTTIIGLYKLNLNLLWNKEYILQYGHKHSGTKFVDMTGDQADDDEIETLYTSLHSIWEGIRLVIPQLLTAEPHILRVHNPESRKEGDSDHLLMWPIGQKYILGPIVRRLLDEAGLENPKDPKDVAKAIKPLGEINWDQQHDLWRGLTIILDVEKGNWVMRQGPDTQQAMACARDIIAWLVGLTDLSPDQIDELKDRWASFLMPNRDNAEEDKTFSELIELRANIT